QRLHLRDHWHAKSIGALQVIDKRLYILQLRIRGGVDGAAVLGAYIVALPVQSRRIVRGEKDFKQLLARELGGVKHHLDDFRMPGGAFADLLIRRLVHMAIRIAAFHVNYATHTVKHRFGTPKAPTT